MNIAILTLIAVLIFPITSWCQVAVAFGTGTNQKAIGRKPSYHNHPAAPLLFEDFENPTGYDLFGWSESILGGTIDEDYTTTVLYGTQSLSVNEQADNPAITTNSFAASSHVYVSFRLRPVSLPVGVDSAVFRLTDQSDTCLFKFTLNNDGDAKIWPVCGSAYQTGFGMSVNMTYYVWLEYNKDNGANSYANLAFSTTPIRPTSGNNFTEGTGTSSATDVSRIRIGHTAPENGEEVDFIMDHLLISNTQIDSYP